ATAEVAGEPLLHGLLRRRLAALEQRGDGEEEPRRAEPALQRSVPRERLLEPLELGSLGEALDGQHVLAVGIRDEEAARRDRPTVEEHGAGPAPRDAARSLRAGEAEPLAQEVEEQLACRNVPNDRPTVDGQVDVHSGGIPSSAPARRAFLIHASQYSSR